jgi:hypothetical protein
LACDGLFVCGSSVAVGVQGGHGHPRTTQRRTECRHSAKGTTTSGICDSSKGSSAQPSRTSGNCDAAQLAAHRPCRRIAAPMPLVQALPGPPHVSTQTRARAHTFARAASAGLHCRA